MGKIRNKKHMAYGSLKPYFEDYGHILVATHQPIGSACAIFLTKYEHMIKPIDNINRHTKPISPGKKHVTTECLVCIWKPVWDMKYHFH